VHTLEKGRPPENTTRARKETQGRSAGGKGGGGRGERVLQQHSRRASTWPEAQPNALLASGACHPACSNCNIPLQRGESTTEAPRAPKRCCVQDTSRRSTAEGLEAWFRPNRTTSHCHPMVLSMTAKATVACNVVCGSSGACPESSRRPSRRPFPSSCLDCWQLAAAPDSAQGPTPAFSLPLGTCLKTHLRHTG
jgi:hypothetical protein